MGDIVRALIECKKIITIKPRKEMYPDKQSPVILRNDFECRSEDGVYTFSVFMRNSSELDCIFSIGLRVEHQNKGRGKKTPIGLTIFRCNHKQEHMNHIVNNNKFNDYHVHMLEDWQFLQGKDNQMDAEPTKAYTNFKSALHHFLVTCNISDYEHHFPYLRQLTLGECYSC